MNIEKVISGNNSAQSSAKTNKATGGTAFSNVLGSLIGSNNNYLEDIFAAASRKYGVSLDLLKAVAKTESNFNPSATSRCGAMGVMQLMPETAAGLGVTDAYDPEQNIMGGAKLLNRLLNRYNGQTELALAAYNAGTGNVDKYGGIPPYKETQSYVSIIMNYLGGGSSFAIPDKYNNYQDYEVNRVSDSTGTLDNTEQSLSSSEEDSREIDPQYLLSVLQLNMQMDLFDDEDDRKII